MLIADKTDFTAKKMTRQKGTLRNDKKVNSPKRCSNDTWRCTKQEASYSKNLFDSNAFCTIEEISYLQYPNDH